MQTADLLQGLHPIDLLPLSVTEWRDPQSSAVGWLVVDRRLNGLAGGGVFMWPGATAEETSSIARTMSKKFAICPKPIGGAKAGICCDLKDPAKRDAVLRRFLSEMRTELRERWVTAGDYGTSDQVIDKIVRELTGHDMQWALYHSVAGNDRKALRRSFQASILYRMDTSSALLPPGKPQPEFHVPFIEGAVGYGVVQALLAVYSKLDPRRRTQEQPLKDVRIAVQGAGAVGTGVMLYSSRLGAQIVAVSDAEGIIYDPEGLDIEGLLGLRARATANMGGENRPLANKLLCRYLVAAGVGRAQVVTNAQVDAEKPGCGAKVEGKLAHLLQNASSANVFVPAASRYTWNANAVEIAANGMWKGVDRRLVVAGANNMFGVADGRSLAHPPAHWDIDMILNRMRAKGIIHVPDFRANGGTAQLFHCYANGELDWALDGVPSGVPTLAPGEQNLALETVSHRIRAAVQEDLELCTPSLLDLPRRAEERVAKQLAEMPNQGNL